MSYDTGVLASALQTWFHFQVLLRRCFPPGSRCKQGLVQRLWPRRDLFPTGCSRLVPVAGMLRGSGCAGLMPAAENNLLVMVLSINPGWFVPVVVVPSWLYPRGCGGKMLWCTRWGCRRALGGSRVQKVLEGAPGHSCFAGDVVPSLPQPIQVASRPAPRWRTGAAGHPAGARIFAKYLQPCFVHRCDFLMNLETKPSAALFAPSWDQSCLGMAAMRSHDPRMQYMTVMHRCKA